MTFSRANKYERQARFLPSSNGIALRYLLARDDLTLGFDDLRASN